MNLLFVEDLFFQVVEKWNEKRLFFFLFIGATHAIDISNF